MLSSVLNSTRAVHVNIAIMQAFVKLREMIASNKELAGGLMTSKRNMTRSSELFLTLFGSFTQLESD